MTGVATEGYVEEAVADMGNAARSFLARLHREDVIDARCEAGLHLRRLREFSRLHGVDLDAMASYEANITNWRAVARLAGSVVETTQAG